jgi:hypothetical protein
MTISQMIKKLKWWEAHIPIEYYCHIFSFLGEGYLIYCSYIVLITERKLKFLFSLDT